jgi:phosphate transport system substrate-binding protein
MSWGRNWSMMGPALAVTAIVVVAGCLGANRSDEEKNSELSLAGSTTVLPLAQACADAYMDEHGGVDITVSGGGSSVGVEAVAAGTADIGMSSRELKDEEVSRYPDLVPTKIANDGIAVILHEDNPVAALTLEQIKAIYTGQVTNWKDVGGPDESIVLVGRDSASGTRASFEELALEGETPSTAMLEQNSNNLVYETVKGNEQAIGYVGLAYVGDGVKAVKVDGVGCGEETVRSGDYPISRALWLITDGEPGGLAKRFIDFVLSDDGQQIVGEKSFVPL